MSRVTRFAGRDPGPAARVAGFVAHLRANGLRLGVGETETALAALTHVRAADPEEARAALKAVCAGSAEEAERFDDLFRAWWMDAGRVRTKVMPAARRLAAGARAGREAPGFEAGDTGTPEGPESGTGPADADGEGRLQAARHESLLRRDLRTLVRPDEIRQAEAIAERLGRALRDRRSRRRRAARRGDRIDFRRLVRRSLSAGGEPLDLPRRKRPDRPVRIVALCDVSGSMVAYARPFLAFLAGLVRADPAADAWLFHTRLVRIAEALRDPDPLRALGRLALLSDGFGGGSRIGASLTAFARTHARERVDGRTVLFILSDGYDSDGPGQIAPALAALRRRGCRIVWLNPLLGWQGYAPVAAAMQAALPYLDAFRPANTLAALAALEEELGRL